MEQSKEQNFAHYSIQFACLQKLRKNGLISVDEYEAIKKTADERLQGHF